MAKEKTAKQEVEELGCALQIIAAILVVALMVGGKYLYDRHVELRDRVDVLEEQVDG